MNTQPEFQNASTSRPGLHFLVSRADKERKKSTKTKSREKDEVDNYIVCKECGNKITLHRHKIKILDSFQHTFLNPEGQIFLIGCFGKAYGCAMIGAPTREWSWFQGFYWRTVLCDECLAHLGWHYSRAAKEGFFGLILDALI